MKFLAVKFSKELFLNNLHRQHGFIGDILTAQATLACLVLAALAFMLTGWLSPSYTLNLIWMALPMAILASLVFFSTVGWSFFLSLHQPLT